MTRAAPHRRADYRHFQLITTRWGDNDAYGHVNNILYYSWFDTVVNQLLIDAGVLLAADGLHRSSKGARVAFDGPDRRVIDGPFAQTRELVAGFWVWQVKDMAEAIDWVKRCPNPMPGPSEIEIRPIFETADFGDALSPEIAELESRQREQTAGR